MRPVYEELVRTAIHTVEPENLATFLGRKLDERFEGEIGNDFHTRIEGTRIKHHMGRNSIKMYDKLGRVLRLETTSNDVTSFKHYRRVEHRDGTWEMKNAPVKKSIYSLPTVAELMKAANRRYLEFLSALDDPTAGIKDLDKISSPTSDGQRTYRDINLFAEEDRAALEAIVRGEFNLSGFQSRHLEPPAWQDAFSGLAPSEATAYPRLDQENRANLQVLCDSAGEGGHQRRTQAPALLTDSRDDRAGLCIKSDTKSLPSRQGPHP
jgi:hypothetical protein